MEKYDAVGLVFPVYYIHAPEIVIRCLENVRFRKSQRVFMIAAYAGSWGYALSDVRHELAKNREIDMQEFRARMPGNHILEYGAFPRFYQDRIIKKAMKQLEGIASAIIHHKITKPIAPNLLAVWFKRNGDKMIQTFNESGTKLHANENCRNCGICQKICPVGNIVAANSNIVWGKYCQRCMACIQWCPHNAIRHPDLKESRKRYTCPGVVYQQLRRE